MWTYQKLEAALARLYDVGPAHITVFRGRLKHFQRLGVPLGHRPGKGFRPPYTADQALQFVFCLEMAAVGIDPMFAAECLKRHWHSTDAPERALSTRLHAGFDSAEGRDADICIAFYPDMIARERADDGIGNLGSYEFIRRSEIEEFYKTIDITRPRSAFVMDVGSTAASMRRELAA